MIRGMGYNIIDVLRSTVDPHDAACEDCMLVMYRGGMWCPGMCGELQSFPVLLRPFQSLW